MSRNSRLTLVTVITPAYNRASYLDETILSVLSQDYTDIEYIVIDDGSSDNTLDVIKKYQDRIKWDSHENMGETRTVNKGFSMAHGEIVVVVNSDDPLLPGAIKCAVDLMIQNPEVVAAYPDWLEIGPSSEIIKEIKLPDYTLYTMMTIFDVAMGPGVFIRRRAFELAGDRDEQFRYVGDLEFCYRLVFHGPLLHIPKTLATHRTHPESASVSERGAVMAEELVRMMHKIYSSQLLPVEFVKRRYSFLCKVHFDAATYCGSDKEAARKHYLKSFCCNPFIFIYRVLTLGMLPRFLVSVLKPMQTKWHRMLKRLSKAMGIADGI